MESIDPKSLSPYLSIPVYVSIQDENGEEAPWMEKIIQQAKLCLDGTHIRLYFDRRDFLAIPRLSRVTEEGSQWTAYDERTQLAYVIRREETCYG